MSFNFKSCLLLYTKNPTTPICMIPAMPANNSPIFFPPFIWRDGGGSGGVRRRDCPRFGGDFLALDLLFSEARCCGGGGDKESDGGGGDGSGGDGGRGSGGGGGGGGGGGDTTADDSFSNWDSTRKA